MIYNGYTNYALPYFFCRIIKRCDMVNKLHVSVVWYTISADILYENIIIYKNLVCFRLVMMV